MTRKPDWRRLLEWRDLAPKLPLVLAVLNVLGSYGAASNQAERKPLDVLAVALLLVGPAALVYRKRWPRLVLGVTLISTLAYMLLGYPYGPVIIGAAVAVVSAIMLGHRLIAWISAITFVVCHVMLSALLSGGTSTIDLPTRGMIVIGWTLVVLVAGEAFRFQMERRREASRAQEAETAGRVTQERLRIAQELHDVVAHNISLINVQAGVALHLMDAQPEQARTALSAIKQASKETLVELRSVLGVLRQVDDPEPRHPAPGVARLPELVERTKGAGLEVRYETTGTARPLPQPQDIAVYRIAQEALTNVLRHSGARHATLRAMYGDDWFTVEVEDDGRGADEATMAAGGSGLTGMRERVSALGGELSAGSGPAGGFVVLARFPLENT